MTPEQLTKLPKYATDYIRKLEMALEEAKKTLDEFCDSQTDSGVWYDDWVCENVSGGPTCRKRFIQSNSLRMKAAGNDTLEVRMHNGRYEVSMVQRAMKIIPRASNVIWIEAGQ